jgi:hypothetical protein
MRRLPVLLILALVLALLALTPVSAANEPNCEKTPNHPACRADEPSTCKFDESGKLEGWTGTDSYKCEWAVENPSDTFSFQIQRVDSSAMKVWIPQLIVNDEYPFPSTLCFNEWRTGPQDLPFPQDDLWTFSFADFDCSDNDTYALTIFTQRVKKGEVELVMKSTPVGEPSALP